MIDTKNLRQALGAVQPEEVEKLLDRLEAAEKERNDAKAAAENIAFKLDYLRSKLEAAENAQNDWLRANAPGGWIDNLRIENEALRAEIIHIKEVEFPRKAQAVADGWRDKCDRLETKIAEMERQEPVGVLHVGSCYGEELEDWEFEADQRVCDRLNERHVTNPTSLKLYTLPGAKGEEK